MAVSYIQFFNALEPRIEVYDLPGHLRDGASRKAEHEAKNLYIKELWQSIPPEQKEYVYHNVWAGKLKFKITAHDSVDHISPDRITTPKDSGRLNGVCYPSRDGKEPTTVINKLAAQFDNQGNIVFYDRLLGRRANHETAHAYQFHYGSYHKNPVWRQARMYDSFNADIVERALNRATAGRWGLDNVDIPKSDYSRLEKEYQESRSRFIQSMGGKAQLPPTLKAYIELRAGKSLGDNYLGDFIRSMEKAYIEVKGVSKGDFLKEARRDVAENVKMRVTDFGPGYYEVKGNLEKTQALRDSESFAKFSDAENVNLNPRRLQFPDRANPIITFFMPHMQAHYRDVVLPSVAYKNQVTEAGYTDQPIPPPPDIRRGKAPEPAPANPAGPIRIVGRPLKSEPFDPVDSRSAGNITAQLESRPTSAAFGSSDTVALKFDDTQPGLIQTSINPSSPPPTEPLQNPKLALPTDEQISQMFGIKVTSFHPEDLPHFKPSIFQGYNEFEKTERFNEIRRRFSIIESGWHGKNETLETLAFNRTASVITFHPKKGEPPTFSSILQPSRILTTADEISASSGVSATHIKPVIPKEVSDFIAVHHEIGHIDVKMKGLELSPYHEELRVDGSALQKYLAADGDPGHVRAYILERAFTGFLNQRHRYWLAPELDRQFLSNKPYNPETFATDVWKGYSELRLRVADQLNGQNLLQDYSTQQIQKAFVLWDRGNFDEIKDRKLKQGIDHAYNDVYGDNPSVWKNNKGQVFAALKDVMGHSRMDGTSRRFAEQIMDSGKMFAPTLMPENDLLQRLRAKYAPDRATKIGLLGTDGILMPTLESFHAATNLALDTMPQQGRHFYLAGKGWGSEIALQGEIEGRVKNPVDLPYRSHSDFELYGTAGLGRKQPFSYTPEFRQLFSAHETFPLNKTKGLRDLPGTFIRDNAETVRLNGRVIKIPELELLFLDKWLKQETTPRMVNGVTVYDYEALAHAYDLDRNKVHEYFKRFHVEPEIKKIAAEFDQKREQMIASHENGIRKLLESSAVQLSESNPNQKPTLDQIVAHANQTMADAIQQKPDRNFTLSGVKAKLWMSLEATDLDPDTFKIKDNAYLISLDLRQRRVEQESYAAVRQKAADLGAAFAKIDEQKQIIPTKTSQPPALQTDFHAVSQSTNIDLPKPLLIEPLPTVGVKTAVMGTGTMNLLMGGISLVHHAQSGNLVGGALAVANIASGTTETVAVLKPALIREGLADAAGKVAIPLMIAQGVYDVATAADGEKGIVAGRTVTSTAAASMVTAAGATGVAGVLLPVTVGFAVGWAFEKDCKLSDLQKQHNQRIADIHADVHDFSHLRAVADTIDQAITTRKEQLTKDGKPVPPEDFVRDANGKIDLSNPSNLQCLKDFMNTERGKVRQAMFNVDQISAFPMFTKDEGKLRTYMALEQTLKHLDAAGSELNELAVHHGYRFNMTEKTPDQIRTDIAMVKERLKTNPDAVEVFQFIYTMRREGALGKSDHFIAADDRNPPIPDEILRLYKSDPHANGTVEQLLYKHGPNGELKPDKLVRWKLDDPDLKPRAAAPVIDAKEVSKLNGSFSGAAQGTLQPDTTPELTTATTRQNITAKPS